MSESNETPNPQSGKIGYLLAWLIGIPIPILLLIFVLRGMQLIHIGAAAARK